MTATFDKGRGFTITRVLAAPRESVYRAWTDPAHLDWFFNPDWPVPEAIELDLRVGGQWRQLMIVDAGTEYITGGIYRELVTFEKVSFVWGAIGGWPELRSATLDDGVLVTIDLSEVDEKTRMVFRLEFPDHLTDELVQDTLALGVRDGWSVTLDRLDC